MNLIYRYVSRQLLVNLFFAIAVLSFVLVVGNVFRKLLPLLVNHDLPPEYLIGFIAYVLPFSLIFTIPWGLLTAVLLVFGRLSADNELVALRANGVSIDQDLPSARHHRDPLHGASLWLNVHVAPVAQEEMRSTVFNLATRTRWRSSEATRSSINFPGRKIYVGKKDGNQLENIIVFETDDATSR